MIIANIIGGLGNQMFQYAAARALSLQRAQPLRLDVSGFSSYGLHQGFELQRLYNCATDVATDADMRAVLGWQSASLVRRILARPVFSPLRSQRYVVEPHFHYWPGLRDVPDNCYLVGYWQSEKYFKDFSGAIRSDLSFKIPLEPTNARLVESMRRVNSISVHVRRGDYVSSPTTNAVHGLCSLEYYSEAIRYIASRVEMPHFYIFSDEMDWVRRNLHINFPCEYVDHNRGMQSYRDMQLMSHCKQHIIANSSFSWWGAWLNPSPNKVVVAPERWFAGKDSSTGDLIPSDWSRV